MPTGFSGPSATKDKWKGDTEPKGTVFEDVTMQREVNLKPWTGYSLNIELTNALGGALDWSCSIWQKLSLSSIGKGERIHLEKYLDPEDVKAR